MLGKEYGNVNMILLTCYESSNKNIKDMFNTVYLENEKDKLSFDMVLFYDFYNCNRDQVNDLTIKIYLLKTNNLYAETELENTESQQVQSRFICNHTININKDKKAKDAKEYNNTKFSSSVDGVGGRFVVDLEDFDFAGFGDYEFLVFDNSTELKDYLDNTDTNLLLAHRCIRVMPKNEET